MLGRGCRGCDGDRGWKRLGVCVSRAGGGGRGLFSLSLFLSTATRACLSASLSQAPPLDHPRDRIQAGVIRLDSFGFRRRGRRREGEGGGERALDR